MIILDTNIWIHAFTGANAEATRLVDAVVSGEQTTAVDTYLFLEVTNAFEHSQNITGRDVQLAQDNFATIVYGRGTDSIENYVDHNQVSRFNRTSAGVEAIRTEPHNGLLSETFGIQRKDAPIVTLAHRFESASPTIYTNDEPFARFVPADHGISGITVTHVNNDQETTSNEEISLFTRE